MYYNIWYRIRRVLAVILVVTLCSNSAPEMMGAVLAAVVNIGDDGKFTVEFEDASIASDGVEYTGSAIMPKVVVKYDGNVVSSDKYTVTYSNNTNVSTEGNPAKVTVTGKADTASDSDGFVGTKTLTFKIREDELVLDEEIEKYDEGEGEGTGEGAGDGEDDGNGTGDSIEVTLVTEGAHTVGEYPIYAYTGNEIKPNVNVTYGETTLTEDTHYTVEYSGDYTNATSEALTITVTGQGEYDGRISAELQYGIRKIISESDVTLGESSFVYDGTEKKPEIMVTYDGSELESGTYSVDYGNNKNAGTGTAKVTANGVYYGIVEKSFTIAPKNIAKEELTIEAQDYNGVVVDISTLVVKKGDEVFQSCEIAEYSDEIKNSGKYTLTLNGLGNYTSSTTVDFVINPVTLTGEMITLQPETGTTAIAMPEVIVGEGKFKEDVDFEVAVNNEIKEPGSYMLTIKPIEYSNLTGETVEIEFIVSEDNSITVGELMVTGVVEKEENDTLKYYYKNNDDVKITMSDTSVYTIKKCIEGGSLGENGEVTVDENATGVKVYVEKKATDDAFATGRILELTGFVKDDSAPKIKASIEYKNSTEDEKWAGAISSWEISVSDAEGIGVEKVYRTTTLIDEDNLDSVKVDELKACVEFTLADDGTCTAEDEDFKWQSGTTYYLLAVDQVGNRVVEEVKIRNLDDKAPTITLNDQSENQATVGQVKWASAILPAKITVLDEEGVGVAKVYRTTTPIDPDALEDLNVDDLGDGFVEFSLDEDGTWKNSDVEWNAGETYYFLAVDAVKNRVLASLTMPKLDDAEPEITLTPKYTENVATVTVDGIDTIWDREILPSVITVSDEGTETVTVYRTTTQIGPDTLEDLDVDALGDDFVEFTLADDGTWENSDVKWNAGETYYFLAVDAVKNRTLASVTMAKQDNAAPEITVKNGNAEIKSESRVYLNFGSLNEQNQKQFDLKISDGEGSGLYEETNEALFTLEDGNTVQYTEFFNKASDYVGQLTEHSFSVVYDNVAPRMSVALTDADAKNDSKAQKTETEEEVKILSCNNVYITVSLEEEYIGSEEQLKSVRLNKINSGASNATLKGEPQKNVTDGTVTYRYVWEVTAPNDGKYRKDIYQVVVSDNAENEKESKKITVEFDKAAATISSIAMEYDEEPNDKGWLKVDTTFKVAVTDTTKSSAAVTLQYQKKAGSEWTDWKDVATVNLNDWNGNFVFEYTEKDATFNGKYQFRTVDSLGNSYVSNDELSLKKDKAKPTVDDIWVEYQVDDSKNKNSISSFIGKTLKPVFAQSKIKVKLYIPQDEISEVKSITYAYCDVKKNVEAKQGVNAQIENKNAKYQNYAIVEFDLSIESDDMEGFIDNLHIMEVVDNADNSVCVEDDSTVSLVSGSRILIIDNKKPTLEVAFKKGYTYKDGIVYYRQENEENGKTIKLTYGEAFYKEFIKDDVLQKPNITVYTKNQDGEFKKDVTVDIDIEWGDYSDKNQEITAKVTLPFSTVDGGDEVEYRIESTYEDGSRNKMEAASTWSKKNKFGTVTEKDGYKSCIIVMDNKAPELTKFEIKEKSTGTTRDNVTVYQHQDENKDITFTFSLEENEQYWAKNYQNLKFQIYNEKTNEVIELPGNSEFITWTGSGTIHTAKYEMPCADGEEPASYYTKVTYTDIAGNKMVYFIDSIKGDDGTYKSKPFVLDHSQPIFNITYNEASRLVKNGGSSADDITTNATPETGYVAYYGSKKGKIEIKFSILEKYVAGYTKDGEDAGLKDLDIEIWKDEKNVFPDLQEDITWEKSGNVYKGKLVIKDPTGKGNADGTYVVKMSYRDPANNSMVAGKGVQGCEKKIKEGDSFTKNTYTSIPLVLDTKKPEIKTVVRKKGNKKAVTPVNTNEERVYFNQKNLEFVITVKDENARYQELKDVLADENNGLKAVDIKNDAVTVDATEEIDDIDGEKIAENGKFTVKIPLTTEANYTIPLAYEDLAGNKVEYDPALVTIDWTVPEVKEVKADVKKTSGILDNVINAITHNELEYLFAKEVMTIKTKATDDIAGIQTITYSIDGDNGQTETYIEEFEPTGEGTYSTTIPLKKNSDFKGDVQIEIVDWATNSPEKTDYRAIVEKENTDSSVEISEPSPSRVVNGEAFYNAPINLTFTYKDGYAGIKEVSYSVNDNTITKDLDFETNGIQNSYTINTEVDNNENNILVVAGYTDNAGHTNSVSKTYNIDTAAPVINVSYDNNSPANEKYYNQTRTAIVEITERNFNASDVQFTITNTDGAMPQIGNWTASGAGDATVHTCRITFAEDGDYTFTVGFQDMAGNRADYSRVDEFTIDTTEPTYTVAYDNDDSKNGHYYGAGRTATIDILEHNFDPSLVNIEMTATNGEAGVPTISGWSQNGDHNVATIHFSADADYTFDISGMDMSQNPMADYAGDYFVVDTTAPSVEIFDIENMSPNNGVVMPGIRYSDINYDADNTIVDIVGYNNGKIEIQGDVTTSSTGVEIKLHDFEHIQSMDDLYTMSATVFDLAGNSSEASVVFSVNRFGSVYTYGDQETEDLIGENGKYYTNTEQDIVITETNVDSLKFKEITCNLNGKLFTLKEGEHYTIKESGSDVSWKQYTYTILKENFVEEGTYLLTIYSEDSATNTSDNSSKGRKIEFVVDKSNPSVLISGIVNDKQYRENGKEITLDVQDNILLSEVKVNLNGKETAYNASQIEQMNGKITFTIESANNWQTMSVTAYDAAGNSVKTEELNFLITTNIFIQFIMNKQLLFGTIATLAIVGVAGFYFVKRRKKKE